jgi:beta-N-acetylhexosaminidase
MRLKKYLFAVLLGALVFTISCRKGEGTIEPPIEEEEEVKIDTIEEKIKGMSLEEKIGQLLIVGIEETTIEEDTIKLIEDYKVGGFILFSRNIKDEHQTLELLNSLKEANSNNDIPLFLSIDEEGGRVSRLPKSFAKLPEAKKIGDINNKDFSFKYGKILGERVKLLGFNMDFAPVLDINSNPKNPVIGNRAFGSTIDVVVDNGLKVMEGIQSTGVIPSIKHFPGHGDTDMDSHVNLPKIEKDIDELESIELVPFKKAIDDGVDMVMVAHILFPKIDSEHPSTMSKEIIDGILRERLDFKGVVISDDLTMGAIVKNYSLENAVVSFLKAGGDIALVCHGKDNPNKVIEKIKEALDEGILGEEEINEKVYRILKLKEKYNIEDNLIDAIDLDRLNEDTQELLKNMNK